MASHIEFNSARDRRFAHSDPRFSRVLHVFDADWHGIRSATACLPGHKLAISHKETIDGEGYRYIEGIVFRNRINRICYQGYSETADGLAEVVSKVFGPDVVQSVVTHVTSAQFEHTFELHMLRRMRQRLVSGQLQRLGSVKPDFSSVVDFAWPVTIANMAPTVASGLERMPREPGSVLLPLENTWRKNLYTNTLAAIRSARVQRIYMVNEPSFLADVADCKRVRLVGFLAPLDLLGLMATTNLVLNVTFAECQPMTQLEAVAVGTPCLTLPLGLDWVRGHPLTQLCEVPVADNPKILTARIEKVLDVWSSSPTELREMTADYNCRCREESLVRYAEFLAL